MNAEKRPRGLKPALIRHGFDCDGRYESKAVVHLLLNAQEHSDDNNKENLLNGGHI